MIEHDVARVITVKCEMSSREVMFSEVLASQQQQSQSILAEGDF